MTAPQVDLVLVVDASGSMQPCFDGLRSHLAEVLRPLQGNTGRIRFGTVVHSAWDENGDLRYEHRFLRGLTLSDLYASQQLESQGSAMGLFTENPREVEELLAAVTPGGNEDSLVALDVATDFPFGPVSSTKRVIALFSDEPLEGGVRGELGVANLDQLAEKLQARHIQLFCAIPDGPGAQRLAMVDRSEIELVERDCGLATVDFTQLMRQLGKSISASVLQMSSEPPYRRALFGQDRWAKIEDFVHRRN